MEQLIEDFEEVAVKFLKDQRLTNVQEKGPSSSRFHLGPEIWYKSNKQELVVAVRTSMVASLNYYAGLQYIDDVFTLGQWTLYKEPVSGDSQRLARLVTRYLTGE